MLRYDKSVDWAEMWEQDKTAILKTMYRNMNADLECGYNPMGNAIQNQKSAIAEYEREIHAAWDRFVYMTEEQVNKWCFYDMKKRGAIA